MKLKAAATTAAAAVAATTVTSLPAVVVATPTNDFALTNDGPQQEASPSIQQRNYLRRELKGKTGGGGRGGSRG